MCSRLRRLIREEHGWGKVWTGLAVAVALAGGGLVYQQVIAGDGGGPPPAGTANLWMDTDGGSCTRSATPAAYVSATACASMGAAYQVAQSGDTVGMADGYYGCESLSNQSKTITFAAAAGATPWIACTSTLSGQIEADYSLVLNNISNLTLDGVYIAGLNTYSTDSNLTFDDVHVTCTDADAHFRQFTGVSYSNVCEARVFLMGTGITWTGGEIGPTLDCDNSCGAYGNSKFRADNLTVSQLTFNENRKDPSAHSECVMVQGGNNLSISRSSFPTCNVFSIFFTCVPGNGDCSQSPGGLPPRNVTLENNYFGPGPQYYTVQVSSHIGTASNFDYRYNTSYKPFNFDAGPTGGSSMVGNIVAYAGGCPSGITFSYNVFGDNSGGKCGDATNISVTSTAFTTDGVGYDATGHLEAGSAAIGRGNPGDFPTVDIDGDARTAPPDAGADER